MSNFDILGNVAVVKFSRETKNLEKKNFAKKLMSNHRGVKTVMEKIGKFKGRLRKQSLKYVLGEKTSEALYRENDCVFRFDIKKTYFSPRLSNERREISSMVKKGDVLVMFAGVAPFSIVIARNSKARVFSNEINREANKYGKLNAELNKVKNKVVFLDGDIKRIAWKIKEKFDYIVMPRPQLKESFLKEAFSLSKKGTRIFYYDFCRMDEIDLIVDKIRNEAKKCRKKIKILKKKTAGEIAPYRARVRVDFMVL